MTEVTTRQTSNDSRPPPGADRILVDRQPYGQLIVHEHVYTEGILRQGSPTRPVFQSGITQGEQVTLAARAAPVSARRPNPGPRQITVEGERSLQCEWIRGRAFSEDIAVQVDVTLRADVTCKVRIDGGVATATSSVRYQLLGKEDAISLTIASDAETAVQSNAGDGERLGAREKSRKRTITVTDADKLGPGTLITKAFVARSSGLVQVGSGAAGMIAEASISLVPDWSFAVTLARRE